MPETTPLYNGPAPGAVGNEDADIPLLEHYRVPGSGRPCFIVLPGGEYGGLSMELEGTEIAAFFNALGISAFILTYRLGPRYRHPAMLNDATRAVQLVRSRVAEWGIDTARIGVIGFSAGGHLAATLATHFVEGNPGARDPVERQSARPDLLVLGYPVITMRMATHGGSKDNLLGPEPAEELIELLSNENHVTAQTPPTFIVHTADDPVVPVQNAYLFAQALAAAGVEHELHVFAHGPHGIGLARGKYHRPVLDVWPELLTEWLKGRSWA